RIPAARGKATPQEPAPPNLRSSQIERSDLSAERGAVTATAGSLYESSIDSSANGGLAQPGTAGLLVTETRRIPIVQRRRGSHARSGIPMACNCYANSLPYAVATC